MVWPGAMPPEAQTVGASLSETAVQSPWRRALIQLALVWLALIVLFATDWAAMLGQWWNSSTYNYILLVPGIVAWLGWQRCEALLAHAPQASRWGLAAVIAALLVWVLGAFAGFSLLRQAGAVALLPSTALLLLGPRAVAIQLFPLAYLAFLVPFGDELVPHLQMITADITIALVRLSAIPATIDGVFINTPAGLFEVAEACSGVKFLIAMFALGVLVSNLCFKSWRRRATFMALCLAVPILANGLRAFGIVWAAQHVGAERAAGVDHLIYGWVFFALVMAAVLAIAWRFFDRGLDEPTFNLARVDSSPLLMRLERASLSPLAALAGLILALAVAQGWARGAEALEAPVPQQVFLPEVPGWQRVDYRPEVPWEPRASGAEHRLLGSYADPQGRKVDVFVAVYAAQREGKEAGGFGEGALRPDSGWSWQGAGPALPPARSEWLRGEGRVERLAYTWYRSGELTTGSNARLKLATIGDRLLLRARPTILLILSAENKPGVRAEPLLAQFRQSTGPLDSWMDRIVTLR
jgi:exosortase A